jgi:sulfatase maturation enzyme AslB (radical SAM superfamily)
MADGLLKTYIGQVIEARAGPEVTIARQEGEPTLMALHFFERAVALAERCRPPVRPSVTSPRFHRST